MIHTKRFIIISALALAAVAPASACLWIETHNYYLFRVCDQEEFHRRVDDISVNNWKAYLGIPEDQYFSFDADDVAAQARKKGDELMATYAEQLGRYLQCVRIKEREQYSWDYPTKNELALRDMLLQQVRTYAQGKLSTKLRSQHALLFMRCNMLMGRHGENITFWEQTASKYIETVYKDMMQNIYAGALMKTGRGDRAGQIFAEQGDWRSLMTQYYKKRSYQAISQEYQRNPQSAVLPFLLQDFVNNAQEATDVDSPFSGGLQGKLFVRDIQRHEAEQMIALAGKAATEGKTQHPALWLSARAWLEFMYGNRQQALADIRQAASMTDENPTIMNNARLLQFYISAMQLPVDKQYDSFVAGELEWMTSMNTEGNPYSHYACALDRITHQALAPRYEEAGRKSTSLALLNAVHASEYDGQLDVMPVEDLLSYADYVKKPAPTQVDDMLRGMISLKEDDLNDLIGTKYLRLCQWKEALKWLERVPLSFYQQKGYAPYAAYRNFTVEPWIKRQWLTDAQAYGEAPTLRENPKVEFAREMQKMEDRLSRLKGKERQQQCYELAVRYAQAHFTGDCWFLMRDGKSVNDEVRQNEVNLGAKAVGLLREVSRGDDLLLKERALFALAYYYLNDDCWFKGEWNLSTTDFERDPQPFTQQYKNYAALYDFEQQNPNGPSDYVKRCDEYRVFRQYHRP